MRYLKTYEENIDEPQIGDYVIIDGDYFDVEIIDFIRTHIGKIININKELSFPYTVEFEENLPNKLNNEMNFDKDEIVEWAYDKEILKINNDIKRYNI